MVSEAPSRSDCRKGRLSLSSWGSITSSLVSHRGTSCLTPKCGQAVHLPRRVKTSPGYLGTRQGRRRYRVLTNKQALEWDPVPLCLNLTEPQFPHLYNGVNNCPQLAGLRRGISEIIRADAYRRPCKFHQRQQPLWLLLIVFKLFFFFFNVYLFLREGERQSASRGEAERERERGRHRIRSRLRAPSCQHRARRGARTHRPRDHDPSRSRTLNRLSHPGAPLLLCLSRTLQLPRPPPQARLRPGPCPLHGRSWDLGGVRGSWQHRPHPS